MYTTFQLLFLFIRPRIQLQFFYKLPLIVEMFLQVIVILPLVIIFNCLNEEELINYSTKRYS